MQTQQLLWRTQSFRAERYNLMLQLRVVGHKLISPIRQLARMAVGSWQLAVNLVCEARFSVSWPSCWQIPTAARLLLPVLMDSVTNQCVSVQHMPSGNFYYVSSALCVDAIKSLDKVSHII